MGWRPPWQIPPWRGASAGLHRAQLAARRSPHLEGEVICLYVISSFRVSMPLDIFGQVFHWASMSKLLLELDLVLVWHDHRERMVTYSCCDKPPTVAD